MATETQRHLVRALVTHTVDLLHGGARNLRASADYGATYFGLNARTPCAHKSGYESWMNCSASLCGAPENTYVLASATAGQSALVAVRSTNSGAAVGEGDTFCSTFAVGPPVGSTVAVSCEQEQSPKSARPPSVPATTRLFIVVVPILIVIVIVIVIAYRLER